MNRKKIKIASGIIAFLMIFNITWNGNVFLNNNQNVYAEQTYGNTSKQSFSTSKGLTPYAVKITKDASANKKYVFAAEALPSSYDSRQGGLVTSVKDQGQIGDCWAFAAIGSVESSLLRTTGKTYDLSEINLATHNDIQDNADYGGNNEIATSYFADWKGPVYESDDPYPDPAYSSNIVTKNGLKARKHVQDVIFIPNRLNSTDNTEIKQEVMQYGTVSTSLYIGNEQYLNTKTNAQYCNNSNAASDHAIDIVGWDDNYSRNNFLTTPSGDGAFICKNSWGTSFGDNGYFYVSYYDTVIGTDNAVFDGVEPANNYSRIYQYDTQYNGTMDSGGNWFSNVFTANNNSLNQESLAAVSFYTNKENTSFSIYVETNYDTNALNKISSEKVYSGTISMPGYHTIKLSQPINLTAGKNYAVAVSLSGSSIPICYNVTNAGKSYYSSDGSYWSSSDENVCLKAFTNVKYQTPVTGISMNSTTLNLAKDSTCSLSASVSPSNATDKNIIWESSDDSIAAVDDNGNVKAVAPGAAVISAISEDGSFKAQCTVNVKGNITVQSVSPENLNKVSAASDIQLTFGGKLLQGSNFSAVNIKDSYGNSVALNKTINNNVLILKPINSLKSGAIYAVHVPVNAVVDNASNTLAADYSIKFAVAQPYNSSVKFGDINLENAIRSQLNKATGSITSADMENLNYLDVSNRGIRNLNGLEYASNLAGLYIGDNKISDLNPIKGLLSLNIIDGYNNSISDLTPIKDLGNLQSINFDSNKIIDVSALSALTSLTCISLGQNDIEDITPVSNLKNVTGFYFDENLLTDIQPIVDNINHRDSSSSGDISVALDNNYLDLTTGSKAANEIAQLSIDSLSYAYQNSGAIVYNRDKSISTNIFNNITINFKNNVNKSISFNDITLYDGNYNSVDIDRTINVNKLIIKPKQMLNPSTAYNLYIPQNAVTDSENNAVSDIWLPISTSAFTGDVNADGSVNIADVAFEAKNYNETWNDTANWNSGYDTNDDGIIDIYDIMGISKCIK